MRIYTVCKLGYKTFILHFTSSHKTKEIRHCHKYNVTHGVRRTICCNWKIQSYLAVYLPLSFQPLKRQSRLYTWTNMWRIRANLRKIRLDISCESLIHMKLQVLFNQQDVFFSKIYLLSLKAEA